MSYLVRMSLSLKGVDLYPALLTSGIVRGNPSKSSSPEPSEKIHLRVDFTRYDQGPLLEQGEFDALKPKDMAAFSKMRDRQYLFFDSAYRHIAHLMRQFSHELFPSQTSHEAERSLHAVLLKGSLSGDLRPLTNLMKQAFGKEDSSRYIQTLASFNNTSNLLTNMEIVAFAAFVQAGALPPKKRREVRNLVCEAMLGPKPVKKEASVKKKNPHLRVKPSSIINDESREIGYTIYPSLIPIQTATKPTARLPKAFRAASPSDPD